MSTGIVSTDLASQLNTLEQFFFFGRQIGEASPTGYIDSNTWRGFRSDPTTANAPSSALRSAFTFISGRFDAFLRRNPDVTRGTFDAFHSSEVDALYEFLRTHHQGVVVRAAAAGNFHGQAYNPYAKVLNLAFTHWCFRRQPKNGEPKYPAAANAPLRHCLHVPLDEKVLRGIRDLSDRGLVPDASFPVGGMGCIRSGRQYLEVQHYLRNIADGVDSTNFEECCVSPLAFDGFWE